MAMIASRNLTTHTYNEDTAAAIVSAVIDRYFQRFLELEGRMGELEEAEDA